ncbi:hypothetical protein ETC04_06615 [Geobacillus sp. MR]|nr:hypothetical protein [Geobacillus sp. MR]
MHWKPPWNASTGLWKRALNKRRLCPKQSRFFRARCSGGDFAKISRMHDFLAVAPHCFLRLCRAGQRRKVSLAVAVVSPERYNSE